MTWASDFVNVNILIVIYFYFIFFTFEVTQIKNERNKPDF